MRADDKEGEGKTKEVEGDNATWGGGGVQREKREGRLRARGREYNIYMINDIFCSILRLYILVILRTIFLLIILFNGV